MAKTNVVGVEGVDLCMVQNWQVGISAFLLDIYVQCYLSLLDAMLTYSFI